MTDYIVSSNTVPEEWFDKFCKDKDAVTLFFKDRDRLLARISELEEAVRAVATLLNDSTDFCETKDALRDQLSNIDF